jgi:uncharacterized protein involved in exopolysaccharide biosynthesis
MLKADAMLGWASGFTAEGPMFWTLLVLLACLVYLRSTQIVAERQAKLEAENARRQEQTYQAMVQHYRQVVNEQQARMETAGQRPPAAPAASGASGTLELFQLLAESSAQKSARLEARVDALAQELEALRRELAEATAMNAQLLGVVSEMQHRINNLSHAVQGLEAKG